MEVLTPGWQNRARFVEGREIDTSHELSRDPEDHDLLSATREIQLDGISQMSSRQAASQWGCRSDGANRDAIDFKGFASTGSDDEKGGFVPGGIFEAYESG